MLKFLKWTLLSIGALVLLGVVAVVALLVLDSSSGDDDDHAEEQASVPVLPSALPTVTRRAPPSPAPSAAPSISPTPAAATRPGEPPTCTLSRRYQLAAQEGAPRQVTVTLASGGAGVKPDGRGQWRLQVPAGQSAVVRVQSSADLLDLTPQRQGRAGTAQIPAGTAEVTYALAADCTSTVAGVRNLTPGASTGRASPPPLPQGFRPSATTRNAVLPASVKGNAANVPWTGSFWLTAPVVTAGICNIRDAETREAAETALKRWQEAPGLGWQIRRDDKVCAAGVPGPKMLILRQNVHNDDLLGQEWEDALDTEGCDQEADITNCWIDVAYVAANPVGFDSVTKGVQIATMIHEIGHALGLGHATICGESVMWPDDDCAGANRPQVGPDDIASLNELLGVTLRALRGGR